MAYYEKNANDRELSLFSAASAPSCEIVKDCIVPDSYTDVKKILATAIKLSPRQDLIEEGGVSYGGTLTATVLCLTEDGEIAPLVLESEYEGQVQNEHEDSLLKAISFPFVENTQSRLINPRKIGIRAKIRPEVYVFEEIDSSVKYPDTVTDEDRMTFEEQYARVGYVTAERFGISGVESGDDIHIDAPHAAIDTLLAKEITFSSLNAEAREGAVMVNATAEITLWYLGEIKEGEKSLCTYRHSLPIAKLVEANGVKEGNTVTASLYWEDGSFSLAEDSLGEKRVCECDFTYGVTVAAFSETVGYVTKDMYSIRYESEPCFGEFLVCDSFSKTTSSSRVRQRVAKKEGYQPIAAEGILKEYHVEAGENQNAVIAGSIAASLVLQNRESLQYTSETVEMPFSIPLSLSYREGNHYAVQFSLGAADARDEGGESVLSQSLCCTVFSFAVKSERAVTMATPTAECGASDGASFTVYYPSREETPWDIAKKYRVREEELILSDSELHTEATKRRAVLIPFRRAASYRALISE